VPDDQQDEATLVWRQECVATIRRAELTDGETSMTAANDLAVRRALELAGTDPS
jgi:tRNA U34 5-methylaminomethyl-2-thiouridine-forming methyltransferase MnmC